MNTKLITQMMVFEFGSFSLDPHTVRLLKNNRTIEIEPQVYETLLLLLEHSNRVVTKDELLQEVWGGRLVTENVITRTIYEIRKIIDGPENKQSCIRTVRGKGYQFVTAVHKKTHIDDVQTNNLTIESNNSRRGTTKALLLVLIFFLVFMFWYQQYKNQPQSNGKTHTKLANMNYPIVAVLPIDVEGGTEELSTLTQSMVDYLTTQLALNLQMKVIHPDNMAIMKKQFDDIWSIQKATRAQFIIEGFVELVSETNIKIHLTLYKKTSDTALTPYALGGFQFTYPHTVKDLNDLYKQRRVTVREIIGLIKPGVVISDDGETETNDPEAYRMVIAAHHIMRTDSCSEIYRAEELLKQATARDPQFAYAWNQLFFNYFKRVWVCGQSTENYQKALEVAEIVEQLAPGKYRTVAIARNGILIESNRVEEAFEYDKEADWDDPEALYRKVYALRYAGFLNLASEHVYRMLQLDPFYFNEKPIRQAPNTMLYLNRFDEHLSLLAEPGNAYHDYYRGFNLLVSGKTDKAKIILQSVLDKTPDDLFGRFSLALLHVLNNDNEAALKIAAKIVQQRLDKNHTDGELTYKQAQLFAMAGDTVRALHNLQLAVDQGFFPANYFLSDPAMKTLHSMPEFQKIVEQAIQRHELFAKRFNLKPETNNL